MQQKFTVPVQVQVWAEARITVEAESHEHARQIVSDDIDDRGWCSDAWCDGDYEVAWETAERLHVADELINGVVHSDCP
jgi:hypothetical protein